jgi:hypothetical protein
VLVVCPLFLLAATSVPPLNGGFLQERLSKNKLDIIDAGHCTWEDAADEYAALATSWWGGGYASNAVPRAGITGSARGIVAGAGHHGRSRGSGDERQAYAATLREPGVAVTAGPCPLGAGRRMNPTCLTLCRRVMEAPHQGSVATPWRDDEEDATIQDAPDDDRIDSVLARPMSPVLLALSLATTSSSWGNSSVTTTRYSGAVDSGYESVLHGVATVKQSMHVVGTVLHVLGLLGSLLGTVLTVIELLG